MQEVRLSVPYTAEEVKDRLAKAFASPQHGELEFFWEKDSPFCHVRTHIQRVGPLVFGGDTDTTLVELYLKELGTQTQIIISPTSAGYSLAIKLAVLPILWMLPPFMFWNKGWVMGIKALAACGTVTLILWIAGKSSKSSERKITRKILETFKDVNQ